MTVGSLAAGAGLVPWRLAWADDAHWTYEGPEGSAHWGDLGSDFAACAKGQRQSPIDLAGGNLQSGADVSVAWQSFQGMVENNGHTLQVTPKDQTASSLTVAGKAYKFLQFHFHHPSEHAVAGGRWPLEIHLVHKSDAGDLAVAGILFRPGRENDALGNVLASAPRSKGKAALEKQVDLTHFLPASAATYQYAGSLTTPPCSEIVSWIVFRDPIEAGIGQIESFARMFPMNARPLQPSFQRGIVLDLF